MGNSKLDRWADKLLDTGKRNNLISFRDAKASTAEIMIPDSEHLFSRCSYGNVFEVFDPKIDDEDYLETESKTASLNKEEFFQKYSQRIRKDNQILVYAQTPNPLTAVKNIAKKSKEMIDETGINATYLAFGFLRWNESKNSSVYYRAPLLLVHVNVSYTSVLDPITIEIADDDVIVNPTFSYLLLAEYGISLPEYEDGDSLKGYIAKCRDSKGIFVLEIKLFEKSAPFDLGCNLLDMILKYLDGYNKHPKKILVKYDESTIKIVTFIIKAVRLHVNSVTREQMSKGKVVQFRCIRRDGSWKPQFFK